MARGKGVILQRYRDGTLVDLMSFDVADGLSWATGTRRRFEKDLAPWQGARASVGRNAPQGFPRDGGFQDVQAGRPADVEDESG
jgi:topoisomerase-4 subunit A